MYRVEVSKETGACVRPASLACRSARLKRIVYHRLSENGGLMAEEDLYFTKEKQPHAIEPGAFVLDLYRLVCMVSASRDVARRGLTAPTISMMQGGFFKSEVTRILISCAAGLRIQFDQSHEPTKGEQRSDCGKLFPNWATDPKKVEVLTLREACNKIIHATDTRFDVVVPDAALNPDEEGAYFGPHLYLYGSKGRNDWRAELSLFDFARWDAAAFRWFACSRS